MPDTANPPELHRPFMVERPGLGRRPVDADPNGDWHTDYTIFLAAQNRAQSIHGGPR